MTSADAAWLHMDRPTNLMVVNSVLWFDEPMNFDRTRDVIRERLVERVHDSASASRNRVSTSASLPGRTNPSFDLDRHIHHLALPAPGDQPALHELVGDLISGPLDRSKQLWDKMLNISCPRLGSRPPSLTSLTRGMRLDIAPLFEPEDPLDPAVLAVRGAV